MTRRILIVTNPHRPETLEAEGAVRAALTEAGIEPCSDFQVGTSEPIEAAIVLGGDGTMLHAAQLTHGTGIPLLGVNMGRVGFLAEFERDDAVEAANRLARGEYTIEHRTTVDVQVIAPDGAVTTGWALNDATVERMDRFRVLDITVAVDGHPLMSFGCDGVVVSTPTGSTAHAFSAGGPVIWPDVDALLCVPLAAHSLFARPIVVGPSARLALAVDGGSVSSAQVILDGARSIQAPAGSRIEFAMGAEPVTLARTSDAPFTERLVRKFSLSTDGWRGDTSAQAGPVAPSTLAPDEDG